MCRLPWTRPPRPPPRTGPVPDRPRPGPAPSRPGPAPLRTGPARPGPSGSSCCPPDRKTPQTPDHGCPYPPTDPERGGDLLPARSAGQQHVQQQPGLERVEEPGPDQAPAKQIPFGAGVGVRPRPAPGRPRCGTRSPPGSARPARPGPYTAAGTWPAPNAATTSPSNRSAAARSSSPSSPRTMATRPSAPPAARPTAAGIRGRPGRAESRDASFGHQADRPGRRRGERRDVRGVRLPDVAGGVDLVGEHRQAAQAPRRGAGRREDGGQDVGRAVRAGQGRVPHGAGHHDGRIPSRAGRAGRPSPRWCRCPG